MCPLPPSLKKELQVEYASTFDQKLSDLRQALQQAITDSTASTGQDKLKILFHQLKGSGKTYEMPEISKIAERAEAEIIKKFEPVASSAAIEALAVVFEKEKIKLDNLA